MKITAFVGALLGAAVLLMSCAHLAASPVPLKIIADVPLGGNATRFDYESFDPNSGLLYIAHMGDGAVIAFDTRTRKVAATIGNIPTVRGVLAVPALHRVFAAAEGTSEIAVIDTRTNALLARIQAGNVDGLAYDPGTRRVFVSDESGGRDVVIDARRNTTVGVVALGGEAGNTVYDAGSHHILVALQTTNELVEIDPVLLRIVARFPLLGSLHSHGIALDEGTHFAFVAGEGNASVVAFDLRRKTVTARADVGLGVDVLSVDASLHRLYVASESGIVSVFDISGGHLKKLGQDLVGANAHVVFADPRTHLVYFPLRDLGGRPVLRIMAPSDR